MNAYYNENDPKAAAWLRGLIKEGHIASGVVDERSITEIQPHELDEYTQHHFFAGIGGWSAALRLAGIDDATQVWTGSCPCQPLSGAGQRKGHADERHLWPAFYRLIAELRPAIVFGEQVASPDGLEWFSGIRADLEAAGYAVGGADLCAAGVGAPHSRQRLYWVAHANVRGSQERWPQGNGEGRDEGKKDLRPTPPEPRHSRQTIGLGIANGDGLQSGRQASATNGHGYSIEPASGSGGVGHAALPEGARHERDCGEILRQQEPEGPGGAGALRGFWSDYHICHFTGADAGKTRRIESGTFPLAHGVSERMGLLRGYGNAIVPQVAASFIEAAMMALND